MTIKALKNRIFIEPIETTRTVGGIIIPETIKSEKPMVGRVLAVGPGVVRKGKFVASEVEAGQVVMFARNAGQRLTYEDREIIVMLTDDILAVIDPDTDA